MPFRVVPMAVPVCSKGSSLTGREHRRTNLEELVRRLARDEAQYQFRQPPLPSGRPAPGADRRPAIQVSTTHVWSASFSVADATVVCVPNERGRRFSSGPRSPRYFSAALPVPVKTIRFHYTIKILSRTISPKKIDVINLQ